MRKALALLCVAGLLAGVPACKVTDPTTGVQYFPLIYTDLIAAEPLRVTIPSTRVFRDQASWDMFWQANVPLAGVPPTVDFAQDMVVGVFWGAQGTGCFHYVGAIDSVRLRLDGVNTTGVIEVEIGPLPDLGVCAMNVVPLQVLVLENTITPVQFVGMVPS